jgi:hypothetical protein
MAASSTAGTIAHVCLKKIFNLLDCMTSPGLYFNAVLRRL